VTRSPHAALDDASRVGKALKIVAQLRAERPLEGAEVLDIGCGNGVIARELARAVGAGTVVGVDVVDQRTTFEGYAFERVVGTTLPFADDTFDIVITNHCIEHVGGREDQLNHLREIARVLRDDGIGYLALPNRWALVEPHFQLPFLSWLPESLRTPYVRLFRRGAAYDCDIPTGAELGRLLEAADIEAREITLSALPLILEIEDPRGPKRLLLQTPRRLAAPFEPLMPTRMFILRSPYVAPATA
jgi:SAM-dependent methyltransferase